MDIERLQHVSFLGCENPNEAKEALFLNLNPWAIHSILEEHERRPSLRLYVVADS